MAIQRDMAAKITIATQSASGLFRGLRGLSAGRGGGAGESWGTRGVMPDDGGGVNRLECQQFDIGGCGGENGTEQLKGEIMTKANRRMWAWVIVAALGTMLVSGQPGRVQAQEKKGGPTKAAAPIETKD